MAEAAPKNWRVDRANGGGGPKWRTRLSEATGVWAGNPVYSANAALMRGDDTIPAPPTDSDSSYRKVADVREESISPVGTRIALLKARSETRRANLGGRVT